jgi:polar amino acid transport system permease protein
MTVADARRRRDRRRAIRAGAVAAVSTVVFFGALVWIVVNAPGWPRVQASFLDPEVFADALPDVVAAFVVNIQLFVAAEILVLIFGLLVAIMRGLPGPVFFPVRLLATAYADIFRALPGLLVIFVLGFGIPGLGLVSPRTPPILYGILGLTLVYTAYVSEVYRAGIDSVHPSQDAAARSLGLSRWQSLRHVVVPQAVRRVIPPLLNDFIGLQKDTVLVASIGVVEIFRTAQIKQAASFNFTPYVAVALVFIVVTIPLARLTDALVARDRRQGAGGRR